MRKVAVIGIGQTGVGEHWEFGLRELAARAVLLALDDAGLQHVDALYAGNMLTGVLSNQQHLGPLIAEYAGLEGIEAVGVESACGSAGAAFRQAVLAVASGAIQTAVAVGVEKLTELSGQSTTNGLAAAADADFETAMGLSFVAINALLMRRYMYEYKYEKKHFAHFIMNAHKNAIHNPNAMFKNLVTLEQYERAKMIADPVNLLDSSPIADGAAAVIVTAADNLKTLPPQAVVVAACEIGTDTIALDHRADLLWLQGAERSVRKAFQTAGVSHKEIGMFEVHDAFSIMTALSLESSGFAERGKALAMAAEGYFDIDGSLPISTFGGLKARGHPVGATGLYQIAEAILHLRGNAPDPLQISGLKYVMTQNIGGSGATVITTILEKL